MEITTVIGSRTENKRNRPGAALAAAGIDSVRERGGDCRDLGRGSTGQTEAEDRELGRGRSGVVFRSRVGSGRYFARKVFGSSGATKAVQYVFLGAPNPYAWCEPAIRTAVLRRRILSELVEYWFGTRLRVARAYGHAWNQNHRA